jgi:prepilin-type N-terminal cleavage/methylation domain-containing protein
MTRARRGFTMLEAIVALSIVGLVCVGVLAAYGATLQADVVASARLPLSSLAVERLAALDASGSSLDMLPDSVARGNFAAPYGGVTWETTARRLGKVDGLYEVTVRVRERGSNYSLVTRRYRTPVRVAGARP